MTGVFRKTAQSCALTEPDFLSLREKRRTRSPREMTAVYETERLWLLLYSGEKALLLQKKDMTAGELEKFVPYLQEKYWETEVTP